MTVKLTQHWLQVTSFLPNRACNSKAWVLRAPELLVVSLTYRDRETELKIRRANIKKK